MRFNQDLSVSHYTIYGYQTGEIQVIFPRTDSEQSQPPHLETLTSSFMMTPETLIRDWPPQSLQDLQPTHLDEIAAISPEVFILGTGKTLRFPDMAITAPLMEKGIGVEIMDNAAACRTFNILMHEGRMVAAGFIQ